MLKKSFIIILSILWWNISCAEDNIPLRIAVPHFLPPFVIEGANKKLSGFDITLMTHLCSDIHRKCIFIPMSNDEIIPAITKHEADLGVGSITITLDRYKYVYFTIPYMLSESRFLGKKEIDQKSFNLEKYKDVKIGVQSGTVQEQELLLLGIKKSMILSYRNINSVIDALNNDDIKLAFIADPIAVYWNNYSDRSIHTLGSPISYGLGIGIAVSKEHSFLAKELDEAILMYQQKVEYNQLYRMYFGEI